MERIKMVDYYKMIKEHEEKHNAHQEFYELAEKYGFCTPWSINEECSTELCNTE